MWPITDLPMSQLPIEELNLLLLNVLLQITALSIIALLICKLFRKNASVRYAILYPSMILLLLLPMFSIWFSSIDKAWLAVNLPSLDSEINSATMFQLNETQFETELPTTIEQSIAETLTENFNTAPSSSLTGRYLQEFPPVLVILAVWIVGIFCFTLGILRSLHRLEKIANSSRTPSHAELKRLQKCLAQLGLESTLEDIRFRVSDQVSSPVIANLVHPSVLLPSGFVDRFSDLQLQEVLLHEIAHIKRSDALANFFQKLVLAIFWFHPLLHFMDKQISRAREEICDNHVLQRNTALQYGETLLAVNTFSSRHPNASDAPIATLGIVNRHWKLEHRIRELLDTSRSQAVKTSIKQSSAIGVFLIFTPIFLAGCQIQAAEELLPQQRIAELEMQTRQLLDERNRLAQQLRTVENELNSLTNQEQQIESQAQRVRTQTAQLREQMSRSLAELRLLLQTAEQEDQLRDIQELAERILRDAQSRVAGDSGEILGREATEALREAIDQIANNDLSRQELLTAMGRLQSRLQLQARSRREAARENQRRAPQPENAATLRNATYQIITEVQELMTPEDSSSEPDLEAAKQMLDQHRNENWDSLNDFEKSTVLNFYTNYWLTVGDYTEAANSFEQILTISNLQENVRLRTLRSLGQIYAAQEQWQRSIDNYTAWRELSPNEDGQVLKGLSYANYQLGRFPEALPYWQQFMDYSYENNSELNRDDYAYLNGIYFTLEMYEEALELTKEMILLFNHPTDWQNLKSIHASLGMMEPQAFNSPRVVEDNAELSIPELVDAQAGISDSTDFLPLNTVDPEYPARAAQRGIEGWVLVSFTVDESGAVINQSINVEDAEPPNIFNRAAIRAAEKFRFQPPTDSDEPSRIEGVQYLFRWSLNQDV